MFAPFEPPIARFARGVGADEATVAAAIEEEWSNGRTEGRIARLKLVEHQIQGRPNIDLLRARIIKGA
ncbi:hypothetical protein [Pikeienuella sp. HZG-20]|uniref:hypothetical protein n=1 Tax=Paludibacillus litoralis TaxID=3133267 RepID=UPI0030EC9C7F